MELAPIALFVYNRPLHTKHTVEALLRNNYADKSELFVFSDSPRNEKDYEKVQEIRNYIKSVSGFKSIEIIENSSSNRGLADSIVYGVTRIITKYGKIIVLEDDLITAKGFLTFMNEALQSYENETSVYQVSGYMVPHKKKLTGTLFYRAPGSWGWGTWKDRWEKLIYNNNEIINLLDKIEISKFNINHSYDYLDQLNRNIHGTLKTWAVKWYMTIHLNNGVCLLPSHSLVKNIGFDGSGENCTIKKNYADQRLNEFIPVIKRDKLVEDKVCLELFVEFYKNKFKKGKISLIKYYLKKLLTIKI